MQSIYSRYTIGITIYRNGALPCLIHHGFVLQTIMMFIDWACSATKLFIRYIFGDNMA